MKRKQPAKRKPAFIVREGSSSVAVYKLGEPKFGKSKASDRTARYCLTWYRFKGDDLQRQTKTGEKNARVRAGEIAIDLANNRPEVTELHGSDRDTYIRINAMAGELGIPLFDLVQQAAVAKKQLGHASLLDAVATHLQTRTVNGSRATVQAVYEEFIRRKKTAQRNRDLSDVYVDNLESDLKTILVPFWKREIASILSEELQDLLNERRDKKEKIVGPRRRRHFREALVGLWNDARDNRHLPAGVKHAAELTSRPKVITEKQPTFDPREFDILINAAHRDKKQCALVPAFAIGAFGRMRMSEIARLDWAAIHLFDKEKDGTHGKIAGEIDVSGRVAGKTGMARIIEITPSLAKWLRLYLKPSGHVLDPKITRIDNHVRRFAKKLGLKWLRNILRGSSTSYLYALTNDLKYVAAQHGTSERELKREYLERKTREQAEAWNAIVPLEGSNILELRWAVNE